MRHREHRPRHELLRLLHGDLPPDREAALRRQIESDPRLGRELARLERVWESIVDAPESREPTDLSARVVARLEATEGQREGGTALPLSVRLAAAAALVVGALLGVGSGQQLRDRAQEEATIVAPDFEALGLQDSLAEAFWDWSDSSGVVTEDTPSEEMQ